MSSQNQTSTKSTQRNYTMFDADISGAVLNMSLLKRLLHWLKPYRGALLLSTALVLIASTLQVLLPIIISLVVLIILFKARARRTPQTLA